MKYIVEPIAIVLMDVIGQWVANLFSVFANQDANCLTLFGLCKMNRETTRNLFRVTELLVEQAASV